VGALETLQNMLGGGSIETLRQGGWVDRKLISSIM